MPTTTDETREARKRKALEVMCNTGRPRVAAQAAGVSLRTLQRWRHEDPKFGAAWTEAEQVASFVSVRSAPS